MKEKTVPKSHNVFIKVPSDVDKTKSDDELDNLEVQSRIYTQLPGYFTN